MKEKDVMSEDVTCNDARSNENMYRMDRRTFVKIAGAAAGILVFGGSIFRYIPSAKAAIPEGTLDPTTIPKYVTSLLIPPVMPRSENPDDFEDDYYEIAVRQFKQQILPAGLPSTTVWGYGSVNNPETFNYPAFTLEAKYKKPVRVKWINDLKDASGNFLPHILPVDQTLHWTNPPGPRDMEGTSQQPYTGPVPIVTHLHGGLNTEESDGFPEAWYLPDAKNIPEGFYKVGSHYNAFKAKAEKKLEQKWEPGTAVFQYENEQPAATVWYHDHALGMTRNNVYAGPAGFYLIRGGPADLKLGYNPPKRVKKDDKDKHQDDEESKEKRKKDGPITEIPIVIQDRSFSSDGSLFYPDNRAFFEELTPEQLQIPFKPDQACNGPSDIPPIWNPEFFANTIVVNGNTWPFLEVEKRRYRFRFLNGCDSRFLILKIGNNIPFWQIGAEGGFLRAPVKLNQLLLGPAERADVVVDFTNVPEGTNIILQNIGPDEPLSSDAFDPADPATTGQVMQFRVIKAVGEDSTTPPDQLVLPKIKSLGEVDKIRQVSLNEDDSKTVRVRNEGDKVVLDCQNGQVFGPVRARLGTVVNGSGNPLFWDDPITENPALNAIEIWEIYNFTMDAHPIHIHEVLFEIVNRQIIGGAVRPQEPGETGFKDTVISFPNEITRVKAKFDRPGLFVWHCHILGHEDNEMMRPYRVGRAKEEGKKEDKEDDKKKHKEAE